MSEDSRSTPANLFEADDSLWSRLERHVSTRSVASDDSPEPGARPEPFHPPMGLSPAVEVRDLTKVFGEKVAVDRITFQVGRGEFFGFLGPNGAGKSTTIRMLCGLMPPTEGTARVAGYDVCEHLLEVKRRIGILPEEIHTYERLSGLELLTFVGRLFNMRDEEISRRALDLFRVLDFSPEEADKLIIDYSMGMKKKIALATALIHGPEVLFLDEPFNGIDAVTSRSIRLILQNAARSGVTIFFSSHILEVVERLCTRLAIIHEGKLVAIGTLSEIRERAAASRTTGLDDLFVRLVGGERETVELDWLHSAPIG